MRYLLAVAVLAAIGIAPASALPLTGASGVSASQSERIVQVAAKRKAAAASHHRSKNNGGVHPLVGSGDY